MKKRGKRKERDIKYDSNHLSQEQMIEIQAEAYYRAIKRIENEGSKKDEKARQRKRYNKYQEALFVFNVLLCPWKINKKFHLNNKIYDGVLVLFVSLALYFIGTIIWLVGTVSVLYGIYQLIKSGINKELIIEFMWELNIVIIGSILILAGDGFSKETDSSKIYAYSASIIALISCIVSIIALIASISK